MPKIFFNAICTAIILLALSTGAGARLKGDGDHAFYLYRASSQRKIIRLSEEDAGSFVYLKSDLKGESVEFSDGKKAEETIETLGAKEVFSESGDVFSNRYFYTPKIREFVIISGKKVNLHLAVGNKIVLGTPLVFGSY